MLGLIGSIIDEFASSANPEAEKENRNVLNGSFRLAVGAPADLALMSAVVGLPTLGL